MADGGTEIKRLLVSQPGQLPAEYDSRRNRRSFFSVSFVPKWEIMFSKHHEEDFLCLIVDRFGIRTSNS